MGVALRLKDNMEMRVFALFILGSHLWPLSAYISHYEKESPCGIGDDAHCYNGGSCSHWKRFWDGHRWTKGQIHCHWPRGYGGLKCRRYTREDQQMRRNTCLRETCN